MNHLKLIFVYLIIFSFFSTGCANIMDYNADKIIPPTNNKIPIEGTWKIYNIKTIGNEILPNHKIGDYFAFGQKVIKVHDDNLGNVQYKIKTVDLSKYLRYNYELKPSDIPSDINNEKNNFDIITTSVDNKLIYEFIIISDKEIILFNNKSFYYLNKVTSEGILNNNKEITVDSDKSESTKKSNSNCSGILLGLRDKNNNYRTLWIQSFESQVKTMLECPNILLPRSNGSFWVMGTKTVENNKYLFASPVERVNSSILKNKNIMNISNSERKILFVGNDYASVETADQLLVLPVDELQSKKGVKISYLLGNEGAQAFNNSYSTAMMNNVNNLSETFQDKPSEENFKMIRKNGHWIIQGRSYSKVKNSSINYIDYDVNVVPPLNMVHYDELCINWNEIKEKFPDASDAYTSPNKDISIIITKNLIYVYSIQKDPISKKNVLSQNNIYKIDLKDDESVIMAEWAVRSYYVEQWQNNVSLLNKIDKSIKK